jgi:hypothetical protein
MDMNNTETPTIRCEWKFGERSFCDEPSTHMVSRIDAIRDHWYMCEEHATAQVRYVASEMSTLDKKHLPMNIIVSWWPPKHRAVSRKDAAAFL